MLILNDFINTYHAAEKLYGKRDMQAILDVVIQIYYLHIVDECMEYRHKCQDNVS